MTALGESQKQRIDNLETSLDKEISLHHEAAKNLAYQLERERARLNDLNTTSMQTEPYIVDVGCQTEFSVPLVSAGCVE
jgi:hypothetical protein